MTTGAQTLISARQAAAVLGEMGVPRSSARRALLAGVAGTGLRLRGSMLYDEQRVRALVLPPLVESELRAAAPTRCFVGRVGEGGLASAATAFEAREAVCAGWHMSPLTRALVTVRLQKGQPMSFLGVVGGFVVLGARITRVDPARNEAGKVTVRFTLDEPDAWYARIAGRLLAIPFGGPWTMVPDLAQAMAQPVTNQPVTNQPGNSPEWAAPRRPT